MGSNEKFCLRWNDFESNISVAFREIREEKDLFDITLSCGVRQIQAHKLILSACSPFFRSVLRQNPHQHPLLYLKGVKFSDLQSVLNFMYHGEVNVAQEELNSFLSVSEELQVKGLTQTNSPSETKAKPESSSASVPRPRPPIRAPEVVPTPKRPQSAATSAPSHPTYMPPQPEDIQEMIPIMPVVKTEVEPSTAVTTTGHGEEGGMVGTMGTEETSMEESYAEEGYGDYGGYEGQGYEGQRYEVQGYEGQSYQGDVGLGQEGSQLSVPDTSEGINDNIIDDPEGLGYTCGLCGKGFGVNKRHCYRHIKNSHNQVTGTLSCDYCQKTYKNKDSLRDHQRRNHGHYKQ